MPTTRSLTSMRYPPEHVKFGTVAGDGFKAKAAARVTTLLDESLGRDIDKWVSNWLYMRLTSGTRFVLNDV